MTTRTIGKQHEDLAASYLQQQGLQLIERNFNCRMGEIDLIMRHNDTLVFVEVRYRSNDAYGSAIESVTYKKQQKILKTAQFYLMKKPQFQHLNYRFDIVGISQNGQTLDWLSNAFGE